MDRTPISERGLAACRAALLPIVLFSLSAGPALSQPDIAALRQQAAALAADGKWQAAAVAYQRVANAYEAQGKGQEAATALGKSAEMYEQYANSLLKGAGPQANAPRPQAAVPVQPAALPVPVPAAAAPVPAQPPAAAAPVAPLDTSAVVSRNAKGQLAVATSNGTPINGMKLSRHDADIHSPGIVVSADGTIHVAFVERLLQSPFSYSVYHRSSADGGKSWTAAKNLSEVMPDYQIGNVQIVADGAGRVYVIWRTGFGPGMPISGIEPHAAQVVNNLVYRVLENGAWSGQAIPVHKPATRERQDIGSASWFAATDPTGKVHVVWNTNPDARHPEALERNGHSPAVKFGMVMESVLVGSVAGPEREIFHTKIDKTTEAPIWPRCDNLDMINGYVDAAGQAHFLALVTSLQIGREPANRFQLIENGQQIPAIELPGNEGDYWQFPPRLLVDAKGQRHVITMYPRGEQPGIRDYRIGSTAEPVVVRATQEVKGKLEGFQAYQGPGGQMVAVMQMNDTGKDTDDELYVSISNGGAWSKPVNITNNTGRMTWQSVQTTARSHVASESYWFPGSAAAAFDREGHLVMAYISNKFGAFQSSAIGITVAGGSSRTPNLLFLRF